MGRFRNTTTGVIVSVDDAKDERFAEGWESPDSPTKAPAKKPASASKNQ